MVLFPDGQFFNKENPHYYRLDRTAKGVGNLLHIREGHPI